MKAITRVSKNIKELRIQRRYSQEKLAELSSLHRTYISQIERGIKNPTIKNLEKIALALEVDISELFRRD